MSQPALQSSGPSRRRLLLIQFAGDFREADRMLRESGQETYYNHRHILTTLAEVQQTVADTTIVCCRSPERYDVRLESGVTAVGLGVDPFQDPATVLDAVRRIDPTDVVLLGPLDGVLAESLRRDARVLCVWADSFATRGWRTYRWRRRLRRQLNDPRVEWATNHGRNACRSLIRLGVDATKVFAWDYTHEEDPCEFEAKTLEPATPPRLFFAGLIVESKGVYDVVEAVARLRRRGVEAQVRIAGAGETDQLARRVDQLGLGDAVTMLGLLPNSAVLEEMRAATAVVVPSRHDYPEGQPLTINEALRARTPIVASDHPMFEGILVEATSAVVFPAGDAGALADAVGRLHGDPDLYRRLSQRSVDTWNQMAVEVKWGQLVLRWARNSPADRAWLAEQPGEFVTA